MARARSLASLTELESGRVWLQFTDEVMPDFASRKHPDYFQIWLAGGAVVERSRSLGSRDLPRSGAPLDRPVLSDLTLPDGRRGARSRSASGRCRRRRKTGCGKTGRAPARAPPPGSRP